MLLETLWSQTSPWAPGTNYQRITHQLANRSRDRRASILFKKKTFSATVIYDQKMFHLRPVRTRLYKRKTKGNMKVKRLQRWQFEKWLNLVANTCSCCDLSTAPGLWAGKWGTGDNLFQTTIIRPQRQSGPHTEYVLKHSLFSTL